MREDGVGQFGVGEFAGLGDHITLDQFGHFGADHVGAQERAGLGVEHGLDEAFGFTRGDGLAVHPEREAADLPVTSLTR